METADLTMSENNINKQDLVITSLKDETNNVTSDSKFMPSAFERSDSSPDSSPSSVSDRVARDVGNVNISHGKSRNSVIL